METLTDLEERIMALPDGDRARLASQLLRSLLPVLDEDEDEGFQEALRRREKMRNDPSRIMTFEELKTAVGR